MTNWFHWQDTDLILQVKLQPGSRRDEIVEIYDNAVKIRITAVPVDGKANKHLCAFLAKICKVKKSQVQIESGHTARSKIIRIQLEQQKLPDFLFIRPK